jgi:flagellar biosynthetic protein FliP
MALLTVLSAGQVSAQAPTSQLLEIGSADTGGYLRLLLLFAALALAPGLLAVMTSFARIVIVLLFLRAGLTSQQIPPNYVIIGLAIFLTMFTMLSPLEQIHEQALQPLLAGEIDLVVAGQRAEAPLRTFMNKHVREQDLAVFRKMAEVPADVPREKLSMTVLIPSFVLSELRAAFMIGFIVYLPFLIIDLVVASTLTSIGLLTLPTPTVALPFKLLLFVMVDGWRLLTEGLLATF